MPVRGQLGVELAAVRAAVPGGVGRDRGCRPRIARPSCRLGGSRSSWRRSLPCGCVPCGRAHGSDRSRGPREQPSVDGLHARGSSRSSSTTHSATRGMTSQAAPSWPRSWGRGAARLGPRTAGHGVLRRAGRARNIHLRTTRSGSSPASSRSIASSSRRSAMRTSSRRRASARTPTARSSDRDRHRPAAARRARARAYRSPRHAPPGRGPRAPSCPLRPCRRSRRR